MRNPAFTISCLIALAAITVAISLSSCAGVYSGFTGQPVPTTPVHRVDGTGKPFEVATTDVVRAESQPGKAWGIYDAGAIADMTSQVVDSGK